MGIKASVLKAGIVKTLTVKYETTEGIEEFDIGYKPNVLTPNQVDELANLPTDARAKGAMQSLLVPMLDWWDVLDDDGERLPVEDSIPTMPMTFLLAVVEAIMDDMGVGKAKGSRSDVG